MSKIDRAKRHLIDLGLSKEEVEEFQKTELIRRKYHTAPSAVVEASNFYHEKIHRLSLDSIWSRDFDDMEFDFRMALSIISDLIPEGYSIVEKYNNGEYPVKINWCS